MKVELAEIKARCSRIVGAWSTSEMQRCNATAQAVRPVTHEHEHEGTIACQAPTSSGAGRECGDRSQPLEIPKRMIKLADR